VVAWRLSNTLDGAFCRDMLDEALGRGRPEVFNTDQGAQFTAEGFTGRLEAVGVAVSMDGRGRAADNVFVERLWRAVKYEDVYLRCYESVPELERGLGAYFAFYNRERFHQSLGYKTPAEVYRVGRVGRAGEVPRRARPSRALSIARARTSTPRCAAGCGMTTQTRSARRDRANDHHTHPTPYGDPTMRRLVPLALLAGTVLTIGCGSSSGSADSAQVAAYVAPNAAAPASGSSGAAPGCYTAEDVKNALGFEVRSITGGMRSFGTFSLCGYAATDDAKLPGVTVTGTVSPAADADTTFDQMRTVVKMSKGGNAQPDVIQVGDQGLAYTTLSQARAAAVANGKLYSVQIGYGAVSNFGDKKEGVITLLRKLMAN
jgi:hypothetical protein